jgi:hypothetical protein
MAAPGVYPEEKLASFGPVIAHPTAGASACSVGGATAGEAGTTDPPAQSNCKMTSPIPPDCDNPFRCYIIFESEVDECDPEWFGCPRTLGVFCLNTNSPVMPLKQWFVMDDPSWLTGATIAVAWYIIEMPTLPGTTRMCSPTTTNVPPGDALANPPQGNYAPCSFQDLVALRELCKLADENGVVVWQGIELQLPEGFCDDVEDVIRKVENPGKYLGSPTDPDGDGIHTPSTIGVCVSQWSYKWDPCLDTHLPNGAKCPHKGGWAPPKLTGLQCMSTLAWTLLKAHLQGNGEFGWAPSHPGDPASDCERTSFLRHFYCNTIDRTCRINSHIRKLKPNPDGSPRCVCPNGDGTFRECPCDTPGAVPGGWDPCDPANGYVPRESPTDCDGGGIPVDDPGGGTGGAGAQPSNTIAQEEPESPKVVPLDWGRLPEKPVGCTALPCEFQCVTCKGSLLMGIDNPAFPQGSWSSTMWYHACEENLCSWEKKQRESCQMSGPCTKQYKSSFRTKSCTPAPPQDAGNTSLYCTDPVPDWPGTDNPDFYNSCPVCKGYKQGTWQCRGNPQVLTRGPWTITFDCKTLKAWADFFKEVRCNQWRALEWSSCALGVCTPHECGVTYLTPNGENRSGDCPPQDLRIARSGDDPTTTSIGYTAKYDPCNGSIVMRTKAYNQQSWGGWGIAGAGTCKPVSGLQAQPGTCNPVTGKSLNCAAGTTYSVAYDIQYKTDCVPRENVWVSNPCGRYTPGGSCGSGNTVMLVWVGSGDCRGQVWRGGAWGGPVWCPNTTGPSYLGCWSGYYSVVDHPERCTQIQIGVMCPGGNVVTKHSGSKCGSSGEYRTVRCITVQYTRNDCKSPNPTAT